MHRGILFILVLATFWASTALAQYRTAFPGIQELKDATSDPGPYVSVSCYYSSSSICAGGGNFDRGSSLCSDDGILNVKLSSAPRDCYYRDNFGLNGIVDARQCGVFADGVASHIVGGSPVNDVDLLTNCLKAASDTGYHIVSTGGGVVADDTADIQIKDNITLTCGGTSVAAAANQDYRVAAAGGTLSKAIVLDPTGHMVGGSLVHYTVRLTGENSAFVDCTEVAGAGPTGTENPYSPSIWFPDCKPDSTAVPCDTDTPAPQTYFRSEIREASAFNPNPTAQYNGTTACGATAPYHCGPASQSVGVTIDGANHATVRDVAILGFGTCVKSDARDLTVEDCRWDCATAFDLKTPDVPFISNVRNRRLLTGSQG